MFESPGQNPRTPKAFEHSRRDAEHFEHSRRDAEHSVSPGHEHFHFTDIAAVPQKWRDHLNCRHCKRQLVVYLGGAFLTVAPELLTCEQKLVVAGCFEKGKALSIESSGVQECSLLTSDAEESDTRVWLHVVHSSGN